MQISYRMQPWSNLSRFGHNTCHEIAQQWRTYRWWINFLEFHQYLWRKHIASCLCQSCIEGIYTGGQQCISRIYGQRSHLEWMFLSHMFQQMEYLTVQEEQCGVSRAAPPVQENIKPRVHAFGHWHDAPGFKKVGETAYTMPQLWILIMLHQIPLWSSIWCWADKHLQQLTMAEKNKRFQLKTCHRARPKPSRAYIPSYIYRKVQVEVSIM